MSEKESKILEVNGYPTFNDIDDVILRNKNRGNVMVNIVEDVTSSGGNKDMCWDAVKTYIESFEDKKDLNIATQCFRIAFFNRMYAKNL